MELKYERRNTNFHCSDRRSAPHSLTFPAHLHYHIEMGLVLDGKTDFRVNSKAYELQSGDLFIAFPNQVHEYKTIEKERCILFIFSPDILPQLSKQFHSTIPATNVIKGAISNSEINFLMNTLFLFIFKTRLTRVIFYSLFVFFLIFEYFITNVRIYF